MREEALPVDVGAVARELSRHSHPYDPVSGPLPPPIGAMALRSPSSAVKLGRKVPARKLPRSRPSARSLMAKNPMEVLQK
jgi:hypothetical protein